MKAMSIDETGTRFRLIYQGMEAPCSTRLIGRHNVFNCLAAAGACLALGVDLPTVADALAAVDRIPGRLELVEAPGNCRVFVDYAHTDDALDNVLRALQPLKCGRIILVFGCGGDRDRTKRPRMAHVAEALADRIVITSDNPRSEDPLDIIADITAGFSAAGRQKAEIAPDRRMAIALAIEQARDGDVVLIAGKGHETYQIVGRERIEFDDRLVAAECIRRRGGGA